ncbi:fimbrillin family protein [uncultured Parabacteroides sp.]|uniref:fimbrillin family protein n=1 Tax=uncultured Parabacteroides sp. TaxID=512312 RepID=UPI0025EBB460|nr:fimbrillin family protein [uncultured Parabacteroides sp.]
MQQHSSITLGPLLALLLLFSCSSGEEILKEEIPPVLPEEKVTVSFSGKMELAETKAEEGGDTPTQTQTLRKDVNVTIRAYKQTEVGKPTVAPQLCYDYLVQSDGSLKVKSGDEMLLSAGTYTFYALSVNAAGDTVPPALTSGSHSETEALQNNTDYLYCGVNREIVSNPEETHKVSLTFSRLAARLQISIVSDGGDDKITAAEAPTVTLPLTDPAGSKITLGATPAIEQYAVASADTTLESEGDITEGFTAGCILLPMTASQTLPVRIVFPSITFNGLVPQVDKLYETKIITPAGGFVSGNQYNYTVNITGNQVGFTTLSVTAWDIKTPVNGLPDSSIEEDY